jgi:mono/diheme cytochrome c family protein
MTARLPGLLLYTAAFSALLGAAACQNRGEPAEANDELTPRGAATGGAATATVPDAAYAADMATGPSAITTGFPVAVVTSVTGAGGSVLPAGVKAVTQGPLAGGIADRVARAEVRNPYANDPAAIERGKYLFIHMNCAYCHGFDGGGGMGPNLADSYWRFGGDDADLFKTLWDGRPQGMPAWRAALTVDDIWRVIAYIRTLSGAGQGRSGMAAGNEGMSGTGMQQGGGSHNQGGQSTGNQTPTRQQREPMSNVNVYLP